MHPAECAILYLLEAAAFIEHPISKMVALSTLWHGAWPLPAKAKQPVLDALLAACQVTNSWKAGRMMRNVALIVATEDMPQAYRIADSMSEHIYKRHARKRLDSGGVDSVYWPYPIPVFDGPSGYRPPPWDRL